MKSALDVSLRERSPVQKNGAANRSSAEAAEVLSLGPRQGPTLCKTRLKYKATLAEEDWSHQNS